MSAWITLAREEDDDDDDDDDDDNVRESTFP